MAASAQKALHDVIDHLTQSRDAFSAALADLHDNATRKGSHMLESAGALRDEALGGLTRASKTTRRAIETRPVESALLIAAVGIAIGWVWRRMQERETAVEQPASPPRRRSGTRSASTSR
ncbi:MAG TPA: hypothetical protein VMR06_01965 [Dokdonella sp.]|uniref:hypothetical protein n=1 Tax=Dokdonella sp. TaxID=2291710 RepID=UPI002C315A27|nr:hypothetical protein [Dokdonella sp.]HUD40741.1 hypothetical protein [Dokdonella sp.]